MAVGAVLMCLEVPEAGLDITVVVLCILTITMDLNAHKQQLADSRSQSSPI